MNQPSINVTPLIDVLLVLLIIFMIVTPLKQTQMETTIPQASNKPEDIEPHPWTLVVSIDSDYSVALNKDHEYLDLADLNELTNDLKSIFAKRAKSEPIAERDGNTESTVFVKAPKSLPYGAVVKVIDAVRLGGASPVSLQIDNLEN